MKYIVHIFTAALTFTVINCASNPGLPEQRTAAQRVIQETATLSATVRNLDATQPIPQQLKADIAKVTREIPVVRTALVRLDNAGTVPEDIARLIKNLKEAGVTAGLMSVAVDNPAEPPPRDDQAVIDQSTNGQLPDLPAPPVPPRDDSDLQATGAFEDSKGEPDTVQEAAIEDVQSAQDALQQLSGEMVSAGLVPTGVIPPAPGPLPPQLQAWLDNFAKNNAKFRRVGETVKADTVGLVSKITELRRSGVNTTLPPITETTPTDLVGTIARAMAARRIAIDGTQNATCRTDEIDNSTTCP